MDFKVAFVQKHVPFYFAQVLSLLIERLETEGVRLDVYAGSPEAHEKFKDGLDTVRNHRRVRNFHVGSIAYWQHIYQMLRPYDLVIVDQSNGALLNYQLITGRWLIKKPRKLAYVGHGASFMSAGRRPARQALKRALIGLVDYWFAYTQITADIVKASGFPEKSIKIFNNSIDVSEIQRTAAETRGEKRQALRSRLGLGTGPIAVFCSRLYADKGIDFLIDATARVRLRIPNFNLVIIGDGPLRPMVDDFARQNAWVKAVGAQYGAQKSEWLAASDVMLMPTAVGLSILDAFAARLPLVTTNINTHGPEIAYLENGVNGLITPLDIEAYTAALIDLLTDPPKLATMADAACESANTYSVQEMVTRFADGIHQALRQ